MNCKLELEQKREEINGIALQVYHESSAQLVNGHDTQLSNVALKQLSSSTKHGDNVPFNGPVSEMEAWELKKLVLTEEAKWHKK